MHDQLIDLLSQIDDAVLELRDLPADGDEGRRVIEDRIEELEAEHFRAKMHETGE